MDFVLMFFGLLFIIAGALFASGKLHIHIKAWQKMSEEEKSKVKIVPLCMNIGIVISVAGVLFLMGGIFNFFRGRLFVISMVIYIVLCVLDIIFIEKSKRYKNK